MQNCCKPDSRCHGTTPIFRPRQESQTPELISIKLDMGDRGANLNPEADFDISTLKSGAALCVIFVLYYMRDICLVLCIRSTETK